MEFFSHLSGSRAIAFGGIGSVISPGTVIGILAGFGLFGYAVVSATDNYMMFFDLGSLLMVLGGTIASTMISYRSVYVLRSFGSFFKIFLYSETGAKELNNEVRQILAWAGDVKAKGVGILDDQLEGAKKISAFTRYSIQSISSGHRGNELRDHLADFNDSQLIRQNVQSATLLTMAGFSPAFGMIGTLVGLIIMLDGMGADPGALGAGLAIALITTLYGVLFANLIFKPAALKVQQNNEILHYQNSVLIEGFVLLSQKIEPLIIQDKMNSYLALSRQIDTLAEKG